MSHKARAEGQTKTGIINSPYVQLLEAKKKGQAYKYELIKNDKPVPVKKVSSSNPNKSYKSYSNERSKPSRKKRIYTEQADESISGTIHEFLQIGHSDNRHQASKSLFYDDLAPKQVETAKEHYIKHSPIQKNNFIKPDYGMLGDLSEMNIAEIDALLALIDHCVEEANEYIAYLEGKVYEYKHELVRLKTCLEERELQLKANSVLIADRDKAIERLKKEIGDPTQQEKSLTIPYIARLLQIVEKVNEENASLRKKIDALTQENNRAYKRKNSNYIFNYIHSKIDILNISIDGKGNYSSQFMDRIDRKHRASKSKS